MTGSDTEGRGLVVLADGVHAGFAAAAVAALARGGRRWGWGLGAGLGAQVAVLALLGEAAEAERRWRRQATSGAPLLRSRISAAEERLGPGTGVRVCADAWTLDGWLDPVSLAEHLAPEMAGVPARLRAAGARVWVCVEELGSGARRSVELGGVDAAEAGELLLVAASFPGGWGPRPGGEREGLRWGGVGVVTLPALSRGAAVDLVCGFPYPAVGRPAAGRSLFEAIQVRTEARTADAVRAWVDAQREAGVDVAAPTSAGYAAAVGREEADLAVEYPLPWERNAELLGLVMDLGAAAGRSDAGPMT